MPSFRSFVLVPSIALLLIIGVVYSECASLTTNKMQTGSERLELYLPLLKNKKVGVVANHTSVVGGVHLVDTLLKSGVEIQKIFSPEHGFRGKADAGAKIDNSTDSRTGLPIISLYGSQKKPSPEHLQGIDALVFDIQDVGVRFYTYISTLHYVMEAAAEARIPVIVLDRPNPNAHYIDGTVLDPALRSFVGMHPVPVVYGMTIGEYAQMINGEGWLANGVECELTIIPCLHYTHSTPYTLPIPPSPNLPNATSVYLYPSLCWFEGTNVSVGRGTSSQFQIYGAPYFSGGDTTFVPTPNLGAKYPKHEGKECRGYSLKNKKKPPTQIQLQHLIRAYTIAKAEGVDESFFNTFFEKLAGTHRLRQQMMEGLSEEEIRRSWREEIDKFREVRSRYLLYLEE